MLTLPEVWQTGTYFLVKQHFLFVKKRKKKKQTKDISCCVKSNFLSVLGQGLLCKEEGKGSPKRCSISGFAQGLSWHSSFNTASDT